MAKKKSQLDHYEHSEIKIRLLKKYLEAYLRIIGHSAFFDEIHLYDLFCGEGIYPNGGKGSPIIITDVLHDLISVSSNKELHSTKFHFTANDRDLKSFNSVSKYFEENKDGRLKWLKSINLQNRDYREFIPELSQKFTSFKRQKAFFFYRSLWLFRY
jgi:three-Cys-motif partner protein